MNTNISVSASLTAAHDYVESVYNRVVSRDPNETEFHQAVREFVDSIVPVLAEQPKYQEHGILERLVEPERMITFRVPWVDDQGKVRVNRGFRVQYNSTLGPYKGGIDSILRYMPVLSSFLVLNKPSRTHLRASQSAEAKVAPTLILRENPNRK